MKVVLLAPTPPPAGGIASWTVRMLESKLKNNWEISLVDEKLIGNREVFGNKTKRNIFTEIKRCFRIWGDLKKALKDPEAAVVHSCIPSSTLSMMREYYCACIAKRRKKKFIMHFRCTVPNTTKGRMGMYWLKKLCKKCDLIITLNSQTEEFLHSLVDTPTVLIPNFISADELVDSANVRDEFKRVAYVGGVIETKGAYDMLKIAEQMPNLEFRLVGRADEAVVKYAEEHSLNNVVFTGAKDKAGVKEELSMADAFLFMTYFRGEGFSNSLVEAMAMGLPCVVTDWAANKDMIGDEGGFVVPVGDVAAAVEALHRLEDKSLRESCALANLKKVAEEYVDSVVIDQYVDAYEYLIN